MVEEELSYPPASQLESIDILGVPVHAVTRAQALDQIALFMYEINLHQIATVNPEFVMKAQNDLAFRGVLEAADLCLADGIGPS